MGRDTALFFRPVRMLNNMAFITAQRPLLAALLSALVCGAPCLSPADTQAETARAAENIIDPHFTGRDCDVCHTTVPEPGQTAVNLKFGGDDVALCNSCHEKDTVPSDLHPVGVTAARTAAITVPEGLPLYDGAVTCRTCHDVYLQCRESPRKHFENIDFLRGGPYPKTSDLCFRCHSKEAYAKVNPHRQTDEAGRIIETQCLYCHQTLPDPDDASGIDDVDFKTDTATFCAACHGKQKALHPAGAEHAVELPSDMQDARTAAEKRFGADLPLFNGRVFCGTCHNPHDRNIIKRKAAAAGSDAESRLRLEKSYDLCVACHRDKADMASREKDVAVVVPEVSARQEPAEAPVYHKSFLEKKCRACHAVTRSEPQPPLVFKMCFQSGCHEPALIAETFQHGEALNANCLLCHNQHGSQYGAHVVNDQNILCSACHPLLGTARETGDTRPEQDFHDRYQALFRQLLPGREISCSYCHGDNHQELIQDTGIVPCYQCHSYIKKLIADKAGKPRDVHETLAQDRCSACHDPHSSPYRYLLRDEPESYTNKGAPGRVAKPE